LVTAVIIGFISGSLGIVWPWKKEIFKIENGQYIYDSIGNKVIENYKRYIPDFSELQTWIAMILIVLGIVILFLLEHYGNKNTRNA
jgi:hypothetical protein